MKTIGFHIFKATIRFITLLPLPVLYVFSDILFVSLYYFPSYRRKVVENNLGNAFPELSEKERKIIARKFYRHLADIFIETAKLSNLSREELLRRYRFTNPELLDRLYDEGKDVAIVHSHYNNWEWMIFLPLVLKHHVVTVYKPLQNVQFDKWFNEIRSRYGIELAPMNEVIRVIINNRRQNIRSVYGFISDQTPAKPDIRYRTRFLNQDTPVFLGVEKIALKYEMPVVFFNVQKIKRGYYELTAELLFEDTKGLSEFEITNAHVRRLEEVIREKPWFWLWSHKRWKHKKPV